MDQTWSKDKADWFLLNHIFPDSTSTPCINKFCLNACFMFCGLVGFQRKNWAIHLSKSPGFRSYLHTNAIISAHGTTTMNLQLKWKFVHCILDYSDFNFARDMFLGNPDYEPSNKLVQFTSNSLCVPRMSSNRLSMLIIVIFCREGLESE